MKRRHAGGRKRALTRVLSSGFAAISTLVLLSCILVLVPAVSPPTGAATADLLRSMVGARAVAELESASYWMRDTLYRAIPQASGAGPGVSWAAGIEPRAPTRAETPNPTATVIGPGPQTPPEEAAVPATGSVPPPAPTTLPVVDVVSALPQIGWQAYGPPSAGIPLMSRAMMMVDPSRSYAGVALVRMDLSRLRLHIMAGIIEPAHPSGISEVIPDLGVVAPEDENLLIAAFNGGFKAVHGHYGMMVNRITLLEPVTGMATIAVYEDGGVDLGAWGQDIAASPAMVALRQNCPPLVDEGQVNPAVATGARKAWGLTNNADVTWRTGLGLTQDRRFLIYAVGNGTTVQFLAEALLQAGAYHAMQLDINQYYAHFVTYTQANTGNGYELEAQPLLEQMIHIRKLYLTPNVRDFFYLTLTE